MRILSYESTVPLVGPGSKRIHEGPHTEPGVPFSLPKSHCSPASSTPFPQTDGITAGMLMLEPEFTGRAGMPPDDAELLTAVLLTLLPLPNCTLPVWESEEEESTELLLTTGARDEAGGAVTQFAIDEKRSVSLSRRSGSDSALVTVA